MQPEFIKDKHPSIAQLKSHIYFGGGEVYARFIAESFANIGLNNILFINPKAKFWSNLAIPKATTVIKSVEIGDILKHLPRGAPLITHAPLSQESVKQIRKHHPLICIVHMPFTGHQSAFNSYDRVLGVSNYVIHSMLKKGVKVWKTPLLGIPDINRNTNIMLPSICNNSEFDWDNNKIRDVILGYTEPVWSLFRHSQCYEKPIDKIAIGVLSRISPIKKFPELFSVLSPTLKSFKNISIEIFGSGGYAQVRDLRRSIESISDRVRFWGQQDNIELILKNVDYILSGMPEREALGLNLIEAQHLGVPVIAVNAPPFTETVLDGVTGWLYKDPRKDSGNDFRRILKGITSGTMLLDKTNADSHLSQFSTDAFSERLYNAIKDYL